MRNDMTHAALYDERQFVNSLGIPVDNLTMHEAVEEVIKLARRRDGRSRWVATLNVDFLTNSLGFGFAKPRHPELLDVLRNSDLVTADGFPILWLSRMTGHTLKQRVTGADLMPAIAARSAQEGLSLYLLGGAPGSAEDAAAILQEQNPGLAIAGCAAPYISTSGPQLVNWSDDDDAIVELINSSGADVLFIGLGNPKQELWFSRNRERLNVPVSMGVGGTFEFITGRVARAPQLLQRCNLEWAYRITRDPQRLWKRYAVGVVKLTILAAPLLWLRLIDTYYNLAHPVKKGTAVWKTIWSSKARSIQLCRLPAQVIDEHLMDIVRRQRMPLCGDSLLFIDFSAVDHVDLAAHHHFFRLAALAGSPGRDVQLLGVSPDLQRRLGASRLIDLFDSSVAGDSISSLRDLNSADESGFGCSSYVLESSAIIFLSGKVTGASLNGIGFQECLLQNTRQRTCVLDMRRVDAVDTSGLAELYAACAAAAEEGGAVLVSGAGELTRQAMRICGLDWPVEFIDDLEMLSWIVGEASRA